MQQLPLQIKEEPLRALEPVEMPKYESYRQPPRNLSMAAYDVSDIAGFLRYKARNTTDETSQTYAAYARILQDVVRYLRSIGAEIEEDK